MPTVTACPTCGKQNRVPDAASGTPVCAACGGALAWIVDLHATMEHGQLTRLAAFTDRPEGGNPAGVWIGDTLPHPSEMQRIAADVGYSESVFLAPAGRRAWTTRYYSPLAEVTFCGHASIAAAAQLARHHGAGRYVLQTRSGDVPVEVELGADGIRASLTSVPTEQRECPAGLLEAALQSLSWSRSDLDPTLPPALSYAGAWHLVLAVRDRATLAAMSYDFDTLRRAMASAELTTVQIAWRENPSTFHVRNPFPVGGVVEDPATGAAAAALGAYLRARGLVEQPSDITIHQGHDMGRPSRLDVHIPTDGGIRITGGAVPIPTPRRSDSDR
jgi:PhzF family phenazine biosynthesis protein